jgi:VWFA-related protein
MRAPRSKSRTIVLLLVCSAAAQEQAVFRGGTRLVEVDVVVRDKNGPVRGLTKDDFTLFDCTASERSVPHPFSPCKGKRQPLDVFREIDTLSAPPAAPAIPLAPGAVSNRVVSNRNDDDGKPLTSATVVLFDQLNTPFDLKGYERLGVVKFLQSTGDKNRIALYSLGADLHILQDFTDDPKKLIDAVSKLDSGDQLTPAQDSAGGETTVGAGAAPAGHGAAEIAAAEGQVVADGARNISIDAIRKIIQHMDGVPGRKNLVWIGQGLGAIFNPPFGPPVARNLLGAANIAVYPVMVRSIMSSGMGRGIAESKGLPPPPGARLLDIKDGFRKFAQTLGGSGFTDATEIREAVTAAEEDANNYYVLGFYPAEKDLDGGTHQLTLEVSKKVAKRPDVVLTYRQVYLATKSGSPDEERPKLADLLHSPIDATAIGLTAAIVPDTSKPGMRQVQATVSLADIQLRREQDRWVGSFHAAVRFELMDAAVLMVTPAVEQIVSLSFTDAELASKRAAGWQITQPVPGDVKRGSAHIVVQDDANGAAGSLRVPIPDGK